MAEAAGSRERASSRKPVTTDGATEKSVGSVKGDKLGAVGSPEGPGCPQSPVCTGTSEEGLPNKSLNCGFLKARRLRQLAHLILPLPMVSSVAHNGQVQLEPASMDHPQDQPPGAEGRLEMDGVGVITSKEAYTQSKSPFKPSYKSHGTWLQRIFKMPQNSAPLN